MKKNARRYYHFTNVYHKWQSHDGWFLRYEAWQTELSIILNQFLHFNTPNSLKNKKFEKMKITTEDVIILHMCTRNDNYMMYGSWDIKCDRQNFLSFWTIFYPPNNPEKQNFEKMKKHLEILSFYKCVPKMTIIWSMFPEIYSLSNSNYFMSAKKYWRESCIMVFMLARIEFPSGIF